MTAEKTPVFLLTGFLGSGKTTLLNQALKEPALANTAVVVNELGEIGLDNVMIAQATDNVVLLDAGCLCCANTGALHETLADLDGRRARGDIPPFERVIIETSGAADPAPLLNVLLGHPLVTAAYAFEATVCAVDAQHFLASRTEYPELDKQAADRGAPLRHQARPRRSDGGIGVPEAAQPASRSARHAGRAFLRLGEERRSTRSPWTRRGGSADASTSPAFAPMRFARRHR